MKVKEIEENIPDHDKCITSLEFNKCFSEIFDKKTKAGITEFITKTYFDEK